MIMRHSHSVCGGIDQHSWGNSSQPAQSFLQFVCSQSNNTLLELLTSGQDRRANDSNANKNNSINSSETPVWHEVPRS